MNGHVVGNLLIVSLWELMGDPVRALDWVGRLLGAHGRVLPMATTPMDITARVRGGDPADPDHVEVVRGQVEVATAAGQIESVALVPEDPQACDEAVEAIRAAEWVVLGPGSWFTPPSSRTSWCRGCDVRSPPPRVAWSSCSTWRHRRGRRPGSGRRTTSRCSSSTPRT